MAEESQGSGLSRKVGPFPLWVWLTAGGVAVVAYLYFKSHAASQPSTATTPARAGGGRGPRGAPGQRGQRGLRGLRGPKGPRGPIGPGHRPPPKKKGATNQQGTGALAPVPAGSSAYAPDYAQQGAVQGQALEPASPASGGPYGAIPAGADVYSLARMDGTTIDPNENMDTARVADPDGKLSEQSRLGGHWVRGADGGWDHVDHPAGDTQAMAGGVNPTPYAYKDMPQTFDDTPPEPQQHPAGEQQVMGSLAGSQQPAVNNSIEEV